MHDFKSPPARRATTVSLPRWAVALTAVFHIAVPAARCAQDVSADDLGLELRRSWEIEDGLPQNSVRAVTQTPDGALWIGTFGGLARFDGRRFQCFTVGTTPELGSSYIVSLLVDRRGALWIGSAEGRVTRYFEGRFQGFGNAEGVPSGEILGLVEEPDGSILAGGEDGLRRFDGARFVDAVEGGRNARLDVRHIHVAPDGQVWIAAKIGLQRLVGRRLVPVESTDGKPCPPASYVGTSPGIGPWAKLDTGLARIVGERVQPASQGDGRLPWRVFSSTQLPSGTTLVAVSTGLFELERAADELRLVPVQLGLDGPCALFVDREESLWIGHFAHGIAQVGRRAHVLKSFAELGLARGNLLLAPAGPGSVWIGTSGTNPLVRFDRATDTATQHPDLTAGLGRMRGLLTAHDGALWLHHERGVRIVRGEEVVDIACDIEADANAMIEDPNGNVWIGGSNVLARIDPTGAVTRLTAAQSLPSPFEVSSLLTTSDGTLWAGTAEGVLRIADGKIDRFTHTDGLPGGTIRALFVHGDALWLGSYGGGLARWRAGRITRVDSAHGLLSDAISCLVGDDAGNLWVNSNRGAFRTKLADLERVADGTDEALACIAARSPESGGRGGVRTADGTVFFAAIDGLACIDPARVQASSVPPGIVIVNSIADGILHDGRAKIVVPPGPREIVFTFNGLSLSEPGAVHYRYRLEGFDPSWRDGGSEGVARYTSVPPGAYRFEVMSRSYDGTWSAGPAVVDLELAPYVHERTWFKILLVLLVLSLVGTAFLVRSRAAHRRQRALQHEVDLRTRAEDSLRKLAGQLIRAQEEERKRVALELHDDLGQRLALLGLGLDVLAREHESKPRDVAGEMRALADSVRALSSDMHEVSHRLHSTKLDKLGLPAALKILCQELSTQHELAIEYESRGGGRRADHYIELALYRIAQEALSNAIRHSDATSARVELESTSTRIELVIEDDGRGFDAADAETKPGLGLQGMRERTLLVGGTLAIHTARDKGTRIEVSVPLPEPSAGESGTTLA